MLMLVLSSLRVDACSFVSHHSAFCTLVGSHRVAGVAAKTTVLPFGPVAALWTWAALKAGNSSARRAARKTAAKLSLIWIETILTMVSTSIAQTFSCQELDGKSFLRAQLTQTCDASSARRQLWRNYAIAMFLLFPLGFPLLLVVLMMSQRARIRELMEEVDRQSALARRSMNVMELHEVAPDSNYQERQLAVKYAQGQEAASAFNMRRRAPVLIVSGLLFVAGILLSLATYFLEAPMMCLLLGFSFGVMPGLVRSTFVCWKRCAVCNVVFMLGRAVPVSHFFLATTQSLRRL